MRVGVVQKRGLASVPMQCLVFGFYCLAAILLNLSTIKCALPRLDESFYLQEGALLVEQGILPRPCLNPVPAFVNGLLYLPFQPNRVALEKVSQYRRGISLVLILAAFWCLASTLGGIKCAYIATAMIAVSPTWRYTLHNSSESCYILFSVLGFGVAAALLQRRSSPRSVIHYLLMGLSLSAAALSRGDGVIAGILCLALLAFARWRYGDFKVTWPRLVLATTAFISPLVACSVAVGLQTGDFRPGFSERTYFAFCEGQNLIFTGKFIDNSGTPTAVTVFGSAEENNQSILLAIIRHPEAFIRRLERQPASFMDSFVAAFGGKLITSIAILLLLFAVIRASLTKKQILFLFAIVYLSPFFVYTLTCYRPGYFAMDIPFIIVLAATALLTRPRDVKSPWHAKVSKALIVTWIAICLVQGVRACGETPNSIEKNAMDHLFVAKLSAMVPRGQPVIAVDPSLLWYAGLEHDCDDEFIRRMFSVSDLYLRVHNPDELIAYMRNKHISYVLFDSDMGDYYPEFAALLEASAPRLSVVFKEPSGNRILYQLKNND